MWLFEKIKFEYPNKTFWFSSGEISAGIIAELIFSLYFAFSFYISFNFPLALCSYAQKTVDLAIITLLNCFITLFTGILIKKNTNIKRSGILQVKGHLHEKIVSTWCSVLRRKFTGGILTIGSGLFPEEKALPRSSHQTGKNWGNRRTRFRCKLLRSNGASAGLSTIFPAPVAGLVFL